jgi:hypothetical protein
MARYEHTFDFCFTVSNGHHDSSVHTTPGDLRAALLARISSLPDGELLEACGWVDTVEILPSGQGIRNPER